MKPTLRKWVLPVALAAGLGGAATAFEAVRVSIQDADAQIAAPPVAATPQTLAGAFRAASSRAMPGVVYVQVESTPRAVRNSQVPDQFRGTPYEDFFLRPQVPQGPRQGSGSGFILTPDGYILTNNHVVDGATRVSVTLTDRREFDARVIGRDPNTDVAVLKIDGANLPTASLGASDNLQIGDWVLALGYPLSLGETATAGIVSAKGRSINILRQNKDAAAPVEHFIQTDAAINPGNSGGPLVDLEGRVIGINTAIASPTGFYSGYGFAVPIELAKRVADDLIQHGVVRRPRLGVQIADATPADVEVFRLRDARGSVVKSVVPGPASDAGVRLGDVIVALNAQPIKDTGDLMERVARLQPGERVVLDLVRYGEPHRVQVKLGQFETGPVQTAAVAQQDADAVARLGFQAAQLTPQLARQLELDVTPGVVVTGVDAMGPAPRALVGFRIDRLNGREIRTVDDLRDAAARLKPGQTVSLLGRLADGTETIVNYRLRG